MPIRASLIAAAVACTASSAPALETYVYQGLPMEAVSPEDYEDWDPPLVLGGYSFGIVVDEAALPGGTLREAEVEFVFVNPGASGSSQLEGLEEFLHDPACGSDLYPPSPCTSFRFFTTVRTILRFETDADKEIVSWFGDFMDGPPDGGIGMSQDWLYVPGYPSYRSAGPGTWTRVTSEPPSRPVPAPAAILLLGSLAALGAGVVAWRRARG